MMRPTTASARAVPHLYASKAGPERRSRMSTSGGATENVFGFRATLEGGAAHGSGSVVVAGFFGGGNSGRLIVLGSFTVLGRTVGDGDVAGGHVPLQGRYRLGASQGSGPRREHHVDLARSRRRRDHPGAEAGMYDPFAQGVVPLRRVRTWRLRRIEGGGGR